jgi:hypothetical protein
MITAFAEGDGESVEKSVARVLTYRGHLWFTSDATTFHYAYTHVSCCDGSVVIHAAGPKTFREISN